MGLIDHSVYEGKLSMSVYQQQTHLTKYSRWVEALQRRETWLETNSRLHTFFYNHLKKNFGYELPEDTQRELIEATYFMKVMPSMRAMMTAGRALELDHASAYNCFSGDTEILTSLGFIKLKDLDGQEITVFSPVSGQFEVATVRCFGTQSVNEIAVSYSVNGQARSGNFVVKATSNHRWILQNGEETTNLKVGDVLKGGASTLESDPTGWVHGFIYGDGTKWRDALTEVPKNFNYKTEVAELFKKKFAVRLCGPKAKYLMRFFDEDFDGWSRVTYPSSTDGDPYVTLFTEYEMKELPNKEMPPEYIRGFVEGLLAADGSFKDGQHHGAFSVTGNGSTIAWLKDHLIYANYVPRGVPRETNLEGELTNYGVRNQSLWKLSFRESQDHRGFRVKKIIPIGYDSVYCAIEPKYKQLTLRDGLRTGNCAYTPVDRMTAHDEAFYLSMCSAGVGFSVERQFIAECPDLPRELHQTDTIIIVPDSRIGWASSYRQLLSMLFAGFIPRWDVSKVRPAGAPLVTFGGRASGPGPLVDLFHHAVNIFKDAISNNQRRLTSLQHHDLMTKMADVAVSGGVRRAAMISLSNPSDQRMRDAKSGEWWNLKPHFRLANNSAVWTDEPSAEMFLEEWLALVKSKSGERGIINRRALINQCRKSRRVDVDNFTDLYGINPCAEIIMRPRQFCNLTTNILRPNDTLNDIVAKVRLSTILGTIQSTLTNFRYLSPEWQKNCEEERLLGVSLNGIMDNRYMAGLDYIRNGTYLTEDFMRDGVKLELPETLALLRDVAIETNREWADRIGINPSAAITSIKPEGNNSNLVDCRPGLHGAHAKNYYIRTNRANKVDKLAQFMITQGIQAEDDVSSPDTAWVLSFPIKVPDNAITRHDYTAIEHLEIWKLYQVHYCEHKPSITVSVKDHEWPSVGAWVYDNFDLVSGVAFLPFDGGTYRQAPYQDCTEAEYLSLVERTPQVIDWSKFSEDGDYTEHAKELACSGGVCTID